MLKQIDAGVLNVTYLELGSTEGWPVILLHGFPYDIHAYDEVGPLLANEGARVIVPYLRGYGPTRFLHKETPRVGQQAALGTDLLALMDRLGLASAKGLVSCASYNIHNVPKSMQPDTPENEHHLWYQYYLQTERGRNALIKDRRAFCHLLWHLWSPTWKFDDATFEKTAQSFDNPDFVDVVLQSYRARFGLGQNDPELDDIEAQLAKQPKIAVPTVALDGAVDGIRPSGTKSQASFFTGRYEYRSIADAGHNIPQEKPAEFVGAIMTVKTWTTN
jgi:pimeloyl-ACP methyl ester carboxylesterase